MGSLGDPVAEAEAEAEEEEGECGMRTWIDAGKGALEEALLPRPPLSSPPLLPLLLAPVLELLLLLLSTLPPPSPPPKRGERGGFTGFLNAVAVVKEDEDEVDSGCGL